MRVSAKGEYALLAMYELARDYGSTEVLTIDQISHRQDIPHPFLVQILQDLKKAGLVESRRGAGGGYRLAIHPRDVSVGQVVRLIDGPVLPLKCFLSSNVSTCPRFGKCPISYLWDDVRYAIEGVLDHTTFDDVLNGRHSPGFGPFSA
jgi:Rrf2 family protein